MVKKLSILLIILSAFLILNCGGSVKIKYDSEGATGKTESIGIKLDCINEILVFSILPNHNATSEEKYLEEENICRVTGPGIVTGDVFINDGDDVTLTVSPTKAPMRKAE